MTMAQLTLLSDVDIDMHSDKSNKAMKPEQGSMSDFLSLVNMPTA